MLLVVFQHIFSLGLLKDCYNSSCVLQIFLAFRMPLFFFLSGFLAYTTIPNEAWFCLKLKNRILNQLFPTIITGSLYILFVGIPFFTAIIDPFKSGYWFTITLFEIFCIYAIVAYLLNKLNISQRQKLFIYWGIIIFSFLLRTALFRYSNIFKENWAGVIGLSQILSFLGYFLFGVIAKMYKSRFLLFIENKYALSALLILFSSIFIFLRNISSFRLMLGFLGIVIVYGFFHYYQSYFNNKTSVGKILSYIGRNTLPIYFLHYFFLQGISNLQSSILTEILFENWLVMIVIGLILTMLLVGVCLLLNKFLLAYPIVYKLMLGKNN